MIEVDVQAGDGTREPDISVVVPAYNAEVVDYGNAPFGHQSNHRSQEL